MLKEHFASMSVCHLTCVDSALGWYDLTPKSRVPPFIHARVDLVMCVCVWVWTRGPCFVDAHAITGTVCVRQMSPPRALLLTTHYYVLEAPLWHYYVIEGFHHHIYTLLCDRNQSQWCLTEIIHWLFRNTLLTVERWQQVWSVIYHPEQHRHDWWCKIAHGRH